MLLKFILYKLREYTCAHKLHNYYNKTVNIIIIIEYDYTVKPVYSGHLGTPKNCPDYRGVLISQVHYFIHIYIAMGPQLTVLIIKVSLFQSVHNNRFDCIIIRGLIINNFHLMHISSHNNPTKCVSTSWVHNIGQVVRQL